MTIITKTVWIADLVRDRRFQVRQGLDRATISRYATTMAAGGEFPAVTVALVNGAPVLIDGWHRVEALLAIDRHSVEAVIVEATEQDAMWMAAKANIAHGLPLRKAELRRVFHAYIGSRRHLKPRGVKSYREMAKELPGVSHNTVRNWMQKDFPKIAERMGGPDADYPGGLRDVRLKGSFAATAHDSLNAALAASRGVTDPTQRSRIIAEAERITAEMKAGGPWEPQPLEEYDF
jgi:ParB-like nuclease domain